jgi:DNA-binding MarR family transcriptional regulator
MAEQEVLDLFKAQNKPFSVQNLCDLLAHRGHKKAAVTRALDSLVAAGTVVMKVRLFLLDVARTAARAAAAAAAAARGTSP